MQGSEEEVVVTTEEPSKKKKKKRSAEEAALENGDAAPMEIGKVHAYQICSCINRSAAFFSLQYLADCLMKSHNRKSAQSSEIRSDAGK